MARKALGLLQAEAVRRPSGLGRSGHHTPAQVAGLRFERAFARALQIRFPRAVHGPWFRYMDASGTFFCQPDLIMPLNEEALVFECKLTDVPEAYSQLFDLYLPVVELCLRRPARGIVVVRHLTPMSGTPLSTLDAALAAHAQVSLFHWLGKGAL